MISESRASSDGKGVLKNAADIDDFVEKGMLVLSSRPQSVEEIGVVCFPCLTVSEVKG